MTQNTRVQLFCLSVCLAPVLFGIGMSFDYPILGAIASLGTVIAFGLHASRGVTSSMAPASTSAEAARPPAQHAATQGERGRHRLVVDPSELTSRNEDA